MIDHQHFNGHLSSQTFLTIINICVIFTILKACAIIYIRMYMHLCICHLYFSRFHLRFIITNIHMQCGPGVSPYYKLGQPLPKYGTSLCKFSSYINAFFIRQPRISSHHPTPRFALSVGSLQCDVHANTSNTSEHVHQMLTAS